MIDPERMRRIAHWSRQLDDAAFRRACAGITERAYAQGATICQYGEVFDPWIGVVSGLVKLRSLSADGKEATFAGVHAGGWFGEGTVLKGEARRYEVIAMRDTRLAFLDRGTFLWLFENSPDFGRFLVGQLNERLGHFMALLENDRKLDPTGRVARALAWMLNPVLYPDVGPHLTITQEEVGLLAGISRPTANQALRVLEQDGALRVEYGGVTVLHPDKLRSWGE